MAISESEFKFISDLVYDEAAIVLTTGKEYLVESRLAQVLKFEELDSISDIVKELRVSSSNVLKKKVVEALTTNETSFFRDMSPFEILKNHILPDIIEKCSTTKTLTIWSAACSTGQEPYTLAMTIREHFPRLKDWKIKIIATDIADSVLDKAKEGCFSQLEVNRGLPVTYLVKYFTRDGASWYVKEDICKMIEFKQLNLIKPFPFIPASDIVLIRNVLIYFNKETKQDILARIRKVLKPHGYMFLGAAETTLNIDPNFERCAFEGGGSCYKIK